MLRLYDQPRPFVWWAMRPFSQRYKTQYAARALPDWKRLVMRRAVFVPELKLLYVINAKAASSTLRDMMFRLGGGSRETGPGSGLKFPTPRWPELVAAIDAPDVYRFTIGRHPVDRAVSSFFNLFVDRRNGFEWRHIPYLRRTGLKFGDPSHANFERFLDYVEEVHAESEMFCDEHLRLQVNNVGARHMRYDSIGHFETLAADVRQIMTDAQIGIYDNEMLGWANKSSAKGSGFQPTPTQIARIEGIYAEDYKRFGYPKSA